MAKLRAHLPLLLAAALLMSVAASYGVVSSQSANGKYDTDGDGLIEIEYLEQLNAVRYDLDGNGVPDLERDGEPNHSSIEAYNAAFPVSGQERVCFANCYGYELLRGLDFSDPESYASGAVNTGWTSADGWLPIGTRTIGYENSGFKESFNGNGYTISNLYINRANYFTGPVGLFGYVEGHARIESIGLVDADVTGNQHVGALVGEFAGSFIFRNYSTGTVTGGLNVGGLVGTNDGTILNNYSTSNVSGNSTIGGLAGSSHGPIWYSYATGNVEGKSGPVGGLVGESTEEIALNYATGNVKGNHVVGGLAGAAKEIFDCYATGNVYATEQGEHIIGGLAGTGDKIVTSYSIGRVASSGTTIGVGGLLGKSRTDNTEIINSYWDIQTSGQTTSAGGEGKTTAELQSPTDYTGPYTYWNENNSSVWDFGTSGQYPAIKIDFNGDGLSTWHEFGSQGRPLSPATPIPRPDSKPTSTLSPAAEISDTPRHPPYEVFEELADAGLLIGVWRYDNPTQSWAIYDPSIPAELNDLTSVSTNDILWVGVAEDAQFQGVTLYKGWNIIALK